MMNNRRKGPAPFYKRAILCAVAGIFILTCGIVAGSLSNISVNGKQADSVQDLYTIAMSPPINNNKGSAAPATNVISETPTATTAPAAPATPSAPADTTAPAGSSSAPSASTAASDTTAAPTTPAASEGPAASGAALSSSSSVDEIVAYFNTSANKIKTNATKVVRNYEDLQNDEEYLDVPSALSGIANTAMNAFLKKNETPVEYSTQADIIANYPVAGESWVSQITPDQIESATCEDDGTNYIITLNFKDDLETVNPSRGTGYGKAFNIVTEDEIVLDNAAVSLSNIKLTYHDGVIKCKVDKATGNMVAATYSMPLILSLTAKVLVSVDAQIGMKFDHDYTITY